EEVRVRAGGGGGPPPGLRHQGDGGAALVVTRRDEQVLPLLAAHLRPEGDRRGGVDAVLRVPAEPPARRPVAGGDAHQAVGGEEDDLPFALDGDRHRRAVAGRVLLALPHLLAALLVEGGERFAAGAAGVDEHEADVDQRRAGEAPAEVRGAVLGQQAVLPEQFAVLGPAALEPARGADRVDPAAVERRRG